ncbi:Sir2 silent information regulator family NAD-dependent deacetylase [Limosilactobacillus frumenti DSM 13145]|uniref:Sir2 silent information regulator family NAD-dependent deacetylase n=1 Tax=Limosilactobacillus frumenti DSM 13145 TaxID=1423746 RepID=A0A0R1P8G8_9LACO|nr:cupin domain-containing protein [Limosilactobacillus frumenti]KRL28489.1 Sir2 silent information regulator family NAD-dependent deacetylase [Limosilactobacillus frumenti DSM 13145]MBA2914740.1 Sir2 silent information regulator family NAD-dependent deacetylase [Limosilactobacillus frumenti]
MTNAIKTAQQWLSDADAILVTASNGFSISEGLNLFAHDRKLSTVLGDLVEKYNLPNLLGALNYHYPDELDKWRVYARIAEYYNYNYYPGELMGKLRQIIGDKPYFIWTSNVDHHFALAEFSNLLEIEGNWQTGICSNHPKDHSFVDLKETLHQIYEKDQAGTLTEEDLPTCAECKAPLSLNIPGSAFNIDQKQVSGFENFLTTYQDRKILVLELGIGPQNQMIKAPSMQLIAGNERSHYITINKGQLNIPSVIADRSIGFSSTIVDAFDALITGKGEVETQGPAKPEPRLSPEESKRQEQIFKNFYPSYTVNKGYRPGELVMYTTIDHDHPSHLHMVQYGKALMYSYGDPVNVHCFTQDGRYRLVKLGLNKANDEVHGFYVEPNTFIAMESVKRVTGFSQVSVTLPSSSSNEILIPKKKQLKKMFPQQQALIERLSADN